MQFAISDMAVLIGLIAFPDDGCLIAAGGKMAVKAVSRRI